MHRFCTVAMNFYDTPRLAILLLSLSQRNIYQAIIELTREKHNVKTTICVLTSQLKVQK